MGFFFELGVLGFSTQEVKFFPQSDYVVKDFGDKISFGLTQISFVAKPIINIRLAR